MQFDTKVVKTRFQIYAGCSSLGLSSSCAGGVAQVPPALRICDLCKKSFSYAGGLKSHILNHTGEKKHIFAKCVHKNTLLKWTMLFF